MTVDSALWAWHQAVGSKQTREAWDRLVEAVEARRRLTVPLAGQSVPNSRLDAATSRTPILAKSVKQGKPL